MLRSHTAPILLVYCRVEAEGGSRAVFRPGIVCVCARVFIPSMLASHCAFAVHYALRSIVLNFPDVSSVCCRQDPSAEVLQEVGNADDGWRISALTSLTRLDDMCMRC